MAWESGAEGRGPAKVINITGPDLLSGRQLANDFGGRFGKAVRFEGTESSDALLSNAQKSFELFGRPAVSVQQMVDWIAVWIKNGGPILAKPTHFEERAGHF